MHPGDVVRRRLLKGSFFNTSYLLFYSSLSSFSGFLREKFYLLVHLKNHLKMKQLFFALCAFFAIAGLQGCNKDTIRYGKEWELTELKGEQLPAGVRIMVVFDEANKRYGGTASCNNYTGTFKLDGSTLKLSNPGVTKKTCPDMSWEMKYLPVLTKIDTWSVMDGKLKLSSEGNVVAVYK